MSFHRLPGIYAAPLPGIGPVGNLPFARAMLAAKLANSKILSIKVDTLVCMGEMDFCSTPCGCLLLQRILD